MKRLLLLILISTSNLVYSQDGKVQAIFDYKQFYTPYGSTYIETYLSFIASSLYYMPNKNNNLQSNILVTQIIKQKDEIIDFKKYEILGPELKDSLAVGFNDQQRFMLQPGTYLLEIEIMDLNDPDSTSTISNQFIHVNLNEGEINISDIELIDYYQKTDKKNNYSKSGYDLYPLVSNYIHSEIDKLAYYFELYKSDSTCNTFLLQQYIRQYDSKEILPKYIKRNKVCLEKVKPEINVFNIKKLPTGNYHLVVELRDKNNKVVTDKTLFFQRVNTKMDDENFMYDSISFEHLVSTDSVDKYLEYLTPIASEMEKSIIQTKADKMSNQLKVNFFYNFWSRRNEAFPKKEWLKYRQKVIEINRKYSTKLVAGYATDMGRIELKYGIPNSIANRPNNAGKLPYQIWHYYHLDKVNNVIFVFYQPDLISKSYELLHSDVPGEIKNKSWKQFLKIDPNAIDFGNGGDSEIPRD